VTPPDPRLAPAAGRRGAHGPGRGAARIPHDPRTPTAPALLGAGRARPGPAVVQGRPCYVPPPRPAV